jgi:chromosome segregation ATPase
MHYRSITDLASRDCKGKKYVKKFKLSNLVFFIIQGKMGFNPLIGSAYRNKPTMQNTKIQALWQLCQELKNRRETLVEKMQQNQRHLDEQQWAMSEEVQQLKHHNQSLFSQVNALIGEVHSLQSQMADAEAQPASVDHHAAHTEAAFSEGDLTALHSRYTELANQLDVSESLYQSRGALLEQLQKTNQHVHYEFKALKNANQELSHDLEQLQAQTHQLIELVESYRQAALEAYAEAEQMQEQQEHAVETEGTVTNAADESQGAFDSKAEAVRDAVRKKIVILLRHRLGKVPRDISSALKNVSNSKTMDQLFELALSVESIEAFSAQLS